MNTHKNAPLTPKGRELMVRSVSEGGLKSQTPISRLGLSEDNLLRLHN